MKCPWGADKIVGMHPCGGKGAKVCKEYIDSYEKEQEAKADKVNASLDKYNNLPRFKPLETLDGECITFGGLRLVILKRGDGWNITVGTTQFPELFTDITLARESALKIAKGRLASDLAMCQRALDTVREDRKEMSSGRQR